MKTLGLIILISLFSFFTNYCHAQIDSMWYMDGVRERGKLYIDSKKLPKELKTYLGDMKFVPNQAIQYGQYKSVECIWDDEIKIMVNSFFISATEVTNNMYREFCKEKGDEYLPDTTVWRSKLAYNEPFVEQYFQHPAYGNYPVVGVSLEKAKAYCQWLSEKAKAILEKYPKIKDKLVINDFRIPSSYEWECAAKGGDEKAIYSFGSYLYYVGKHKMIMPYANFGITKDEFGLPIEGLPWMSSRFDITAPVNNFKPNGYGLYNMSGNVCEWTSTIYPENIEEIKKYAYEKDNYGKCIIKGGGWKDGPYYLRISARKYKKNEEAADDLGFRIVMSFR